MDRHDYEDRLGAARKPCSSIQCNAARTGRCARRWGFASPPGRHPDAASLISSKCLYISLY
jgi:hypothetical protein